MKYKIIFVFIVLIINLINSVYAEPYIGLNIGGNITSISKTINYDLSSLNLKDISTGFRGQALLGYNVHWKSSYAYWEDDPYKHDNTNDELFLALEVDWNYNSDNTTSSISNWFLNHEASVREQLRYSYDIFLLAKYHYPQNVIWFLGPGYSKGHLEISTPAQTAGNLGITGSATEWLSGWSAKAGLEIAIANCLNVIATYQYTSLNELKANRIEPLSGVTINAKYKPSLNSITIGIIYFISDLF